jgi:hypothetical protein
VGKPGAVLVDGLEQPDVGKETAMLCARAKPPSIGRAASRLSTLLLPMTSSAAGRRKASPTLQLGLHRVEGVVNQTSFTNTVHVNHSSEANGVYWPIGLCLSSTELSAL